MSASPMAAHCQHACKHFALYVQLYCSTTYKTSHQSILTYTEKNLTKAHTLILYTAVHGPPFDARNNNIHVTFSYKTGC